MRRDTGDGTRVRGRIVALVSVACILGWVIPAILMLGKGFAIEDEGTYVLSYRFWSANPYFVSGSQYVYGPVFEALGESIPALRLVRLAMVVGFNLWFALSFVGWLERERPGALPASRAALVLLLTAGGGMSYLWTPLTPGYYDLTAQACLALVALMFATLRMPPRRLLTQAGASGFFCVVLVMTKWTATPVAVLTVGVAVWSLAGVGRGAALRYVAVVAAGVAAALVLCQVFLVPVGRVVSVMNRVSSLTATASHSFGYLARSYTSNTVSFTVGAVVFATPLLAAYLLARRAGSRSGALTWLVGAGIVTAGVLPFVVGWHGGADHGRAVVALALGGLLAALVVGLASRPRGGPLLDATRGRSAAVATVLVLVPVFQAVGTNVPVIYVALECVGMWMALVLMLVAWDDCPEIAVTAVVTDLVVLVVGSAMIAGSSTVMDPFKTGGLRADTVHVGSLGVALPPEVARQYQALETAVSPYVVRGATPIFTLDQLAGLTYLLGGVPAGSTWTDAVSPSRTAGILELACRNGDVSRDRKPVLLFGRRPDPEVRRAMATCGFDYPAAYRRLAVPGGPPGIAAFVPRGVRG